MLKAWKNWRNNTSLSDKEFLRFYIWDRMIIKPKRRLRRWPKRY